MRSSSSPSVSDAYDVPVRVLALAFILASVLLASCGGDSADEITPGSPLAQPAEGVDDGSPWVIESPSAVGLNSEAVDALLEIVRETPPRDFRALVVIKDGNLVVEEYFNSFWRTNIHDVRSAGKSVTSMLAGIAIDQGLIETSDSVLSYFPEYEVDGAVLKQEIIVADLLTMSSGLASDDYQEDSPGREEAMLVEQDFVRFVLDLPLGFAPGERFAYSSAVAFLLGAVIEQAAGQSLEEFAREHLLGPLGIRELYWQRSPQGRTAGMGNLYLRAVDFAKLGQLMLDQGRWGTRQVLSSEWIDRSLNKAFDISQVDPFASGYGFMWYLAKADVGGETFDYYFASGNGGNKLFVVPAKKLVVVAFSSAYGQGYGHQRSHNIFAGILDALDG